MTEKKPYLPVSQDKLVHDLAVAWLIREKKEFKSPDDFANKYLKLIQNFQASVDDLTRYDFNPNPSEDI